MSNYHCLHTKGFTVCLINSRIEEILQPIEEVSVGEPIGVKRLVKCGMAIFSAGLSVPMSLYDLNSGLLVGRVEIPDEVRGAMIPQSFCDPEDDLELDLVG